MSEGTATDTTTTTSPSYLFTFGCNLRSEGGLLKLVLVKCTTWGTFQVCFESPPRVLKQGIE